MNLGENAMTVLAVALVVLVFMPVVLIAKMPRRATPWIALVWIVFPIPAYWILIAAESAARPGDTADSMENAWAGFYLLSAVLAVPWLIFWAGGVAIGIALRNGRLQRPLARAAAAASDTVARAQPEPHYAEPIDPTLDRAATQRLHDRIRTLADKTGIVRKVLPIVEASDDGTEFVYASSNGYVLAHRHAGPPHDLSATADLDEILYWAFDIATYLMACDEFFSSALDPDERAARVLERQAALLEAVDPRWYARWLDDPSRREAHFRNSALK